MDTSVVGIKKHLINHNIKPSHHRIEIMRYLLLQRNHPTAEQIYKGLIKRVPTLSKTTVYNTLNLFCSTNIVRTITIEEHETRFDADILEHGHFKCENCDKIYDFKINNLDFQTTELDGFEIKDKDVYFKGICPKCLYDKKK